jgi:hypothetical protein
MLRHLNWVAILVTSFLYTVVGTAWYSPVLFGAFVESRCSEPMHMIYLGSFLIAVLLAACLSVLFDAAKAKSVSDAVCVGFTAWLGLTLAPMLCGSLWSGMPVMLVAIHAGYVLCGVLIASFVSVHMKK